VEGTTVVKNQQSYRPGPPAPSRRTSADEAREQARRALQMSIDTRQ
jgi:hypothetical protein